MWVNEGSVSGTHESFTMKQVCGLMKVLFQVLVKVLP